VSCEMTNERLHAFLDAELSPPSALEVESHLRACPSCAAAYGRLRSLRSALRADALTYPPPAALLARVRAGVAPTQPRRKRLISPPLALAASLLLGVAIGRFLLPASRDVSTDLTAQAIVDAHVRALASGNLAEVASSDQHTVKPWFAGKLDFSPKVKGLAAQGFPLVGGRVDRLGGRTVAALAYGRAKHTIDLFVWVAPSPSRAVASSRVRGINVVRWTEDDLSYAAVSDLNETELTAFAELVRRP
jgi:anti-sigma factor RsiW